MLEDIDSVKEFLAWCREHGVVEVEVGGVRATFRGPKPAPAPDPPAKKIDERTGYDEADLYGAVD